MRWFRFVTPLVLGCIFGCGSGERPTAMVDAKVSIDGRPFPAGTLVVTSEDGLYSDNAQIVKGHAAVPRAPIGKIRVAVLPIKTPSQKPIRPAAGGKPSGGSPTAPAFPSHYSDPNRSGLLIEVAEGSNSVEIPLSSRSTSSR